MTWYREELPEGYRMPEGIGEGARADMRLALDALHQYVQDAEQDASTTAAHFAAWEAELLPTPVEGIGALSAYGYFVEPCERGFELYFLEGSNDLYSVEIQGHGDAAPTREIAEAEAVRRIERGQIGRPS